MKFLLMLTWAPEWDRLPPAEQQRVVETHGRLKEELTRQGKFVESSALRSPSEAVTVRRREGKPVVVDGPFTEAKEAIGGFYIVKAASRDEAIEWAKKVPVVGSGGVEVRALWEEG